MALGAPALRPVLAFRNPSSRWGVHVEGAEEIFAGLELVLRFARAQGVGLLPDFMLPAANSSLHRKSREFDGRVAAGFHHVGGAAVLQEDFQVAVAVDEGVRRIE